MAVNDFRVLKHGYSVIRFRTEDTTTSALTGVIAGGDLVKIGGTGTNYATILLTGDPEQGTDLFLGVTRGSSTETTTANGVVDVELCGQGTILEGKAATTTNVNTDAKLLLLLNDYVACDRSAETKAGVLTIDEDEGTDAAIHGFIILDGDIVKGTLKVGVGPATFWEGTV